MKKTYEYDSQLSEIEQKNSDVAHNLMTMLNARGVIGDSAGLLTASFAGFAFICVLLTLIFQFISSRFQNIFIQKQQFENTFFNMLNRQENITATINYGNINGRKAFSQVYFIELKKQFEKFGNNLLEIQNTYKANYLNIFGHYFCHLYRIIKFVDENKNLTNEEKSNYIDILRAGLSPYEIVLLFYNGLCFVNTAKKFVEKYALLNNLRDEFLSNKEHIVLYNIKAYGNNELLIQKYNELNGNKK